MDWLAIKTELVGELHRIVDEKINTIQLALQNAQSSANNETKSSAGDKHETSRAMAHLEAEKNSRQLEEALNLKKILDQIVISEEASSGTGSLIITKTGKFFISVGIGRVALNGTDYFAISPQAPIAQLLMKANPGETIQFNGRKFEIETKA